MTKFKVATKIGRIAEKLQNIGFWRIGSIMEEICKKISLNAADMLFDYTGWNDFEWEGDEEEK